jgi:hypothetical protein
MKIWRKIDYFNDYQTKGLSSLKEIFILVIHEKEKIKRKLKKTTDEQMKASLNLNKPPASAMSDKVFNNMIESEELNFDYDETLDDLQINLLVDDEIMKFTKIIREKSFLEENFTTKQFWLKHKTLIPNLFNLSLIILNILPSSSVIERFFSICGVICENRRLAMKDDLLIERSLLKTNIKILEELSITSE